MYTITYSDPVVLLNCARKAVAKGAKVKLYDDLINHRFGYRVGDDTSWMITLTDLERASTDPAKKDLAELLKTPEGRLKVLGDGLFWDTVKNAS
jgi:hypothetical protein